ncbi:MAG TPA: hypothetical protein VJS12_24235 [Steroidobacteraceae bacterium]|nr:hypothetical protein [Steroidobacteraceae bacterium]
MRVPVLVAISLALTFLTGFSPRSAAQPVTLHEQQHISLPPLYDFGARDVCLHGSDLLAIAVRDRQDPEHLFGEIASLVHFKQQADGTWQFVGELVSVLVDSAENIWGAPDLDCEGSLGAFSHPAGNAYVIEFTSGGVKLTELPLSRPSHVDVYRGTVGVAGSFGSPTAVALVRKNAAGQWADITYAVGNPGTRFDTPEISGPNSLWVATTEIGATGDEYEPTPSEFVGRDIQIFDLSGGSWRVMTVDEPCCPLGAVIDDRVALQLDQWTKPGDVGSYFVRDATGAWTVQHSLLSDEHIFLDEAVFVGQRAFAALARNEGEIGVFRQDAAGQYRHEATLDPSDLLPRFIPEPWPRQVKLSVDGNRVAASTEGADLYVFDIPATLPVPRRLEKSFSNPSTADWAFSGKTDWRIASSGVSRVFQQLKTDAWARAVLTTFSGTDLSIEADVRIQELATVSSGAGFLVRYTDLQNYYYLLARPTSLQVGKIVNGVFQQIGTAPLSLVLGRTYRFRIEAIGSHLRAYVNGERVVDVIDESHTRGLAGLTMFRARTDYDNVIVTTSPQTLLFSDFSRNFNEGSRPWTSAPANAWSIVPDVPHGPFPEVLYRQSLLTGTPRAVNGGPTRDQIVSALVRPQAFRAGVADAFVGLMARHVDDNNHYYVALFRDRAAIRKRVNGVHSSIKQVPFTFLPGVAYRARLEAIGSSLRLYINEALVAEGVDATLPTGRYGLITFNATADFDNFRVVRP